MNEYLNYCESIFFDNKTLYDGVIYGYNTLLESYNYSKQHDDIERAVNSVIYLINKHSDEISNGQSVNVRFIAKQNLQPIVDPNTGMPEYITLSVLNDDDMAKTQFDKNALMCCTASKNLIIPIRTIYYNVDRNIPVSYILMNMLDEPKYPDGGSLRSTMFHEMQHIYDNMFIAHGRGTHKSVQRNIINREKNDDSEAASTWSYVAALQEIRARARSYYAFWRKRIDDVKKPSNPTLFRDRVYDCADYLMNGIENSSENRYDVPHSFKKYILKKAYDICEQLRQYSLRYSETIAKK